MIDNTLWPPYVMGNWDLPDRTIPAELCDPWPSNGNTTETVYSSYPEEIFTEFECFPINSMLTAPLAEVLSVTISTSTSTSTGASSHHHQVHGRITVTDCDGSSFTLFDRDEEDPETVNDGSITLTRAKGPAIHASDNVKVEILLLDKADSNAIIAQGCLYLNYRDHPSGYEYGVVHADTVRGGQCEGSAAVIRHITYPHAVVANFKVFLECPDRDDTVPVYGEIVANFGHGNPCVSIFSRREDEPLIVKADSSIQLDREVVVVPVSAAPFLLITPDLWNRDTKERIVPKRDASFRVEYDSLQMVDFVIGAHNQIQVHLVWSHPFKHLWLTSQLTSSVIVRNKYISKPLMEVFSVSVCSKSGEGVDVFGSIVSCCSDVESCMWSKDETSAERLLSNQTLSLSTPTLTMLAPGSCIGGPYIVLKVNLRDRKGSGISKGCLTSDAVQFKCPIPFLNDRQLCSVVPGTTGYAAIHYAIFAEGLLAKVKICLVGNSESSSCDAPPHVVYGSVFTEYSNYKYVTEYQKECYRSKLFCRQFGDPLPLSSESEVPLTKYVVAVPKGSMLVVDVNLAITSPEKDGLSSSVVETFKDRLEFDIDIGHIALEIPGMHHKMLVSVEWKDAISEFGQTLAC